MTLQEFREFTENMPDDTELAFAYGEEILDVKTFNVSRSNKLVMCNKIYGKSDMIEIYKAILILNDIRKLKGIDHQQ